MTNTVKQALANDESGIINDVVCEVLSTILSSNRVINAVMLEALNDKDALDGYQLKHTDCDYIGDIPFQYLWELIQREPKG